MIRNIQRTLRIHKYLRYIKIFESRLKVTQSSSDFEVMWNSTAEEGIRIYSNKIRENKLDNVTVSKP